MSFFQKQKIVECKCAARKNAEFINTYNEIDIYSDIDEVDLLILLEFKEHEKLEDYFKNFCIKKCNKENISFAFVYALGCTPKNYKSDDTVQTYKQCKKYNIKKIINKLNPKIIITSGRAIYTITENRDLRPEHFYSLHKDDQWMYTPEFNSKVFPIPPLYQFAHIDNYEWEFTKKQLDKACISIKERSSRKLNLSFFDVENPNNFIKNIISNNDIKWIALDTETSGLNYFKDTLYNISLSYNTKDGYFLKFDDIDKNLLIELFNSDKKFIFHNASFDMKFLKSNGIHNVRCDFDTMLAAHSINENSPNDLKSLSYIYTHFGGYDREVKQFLIEHKTKNFLDLPKDLLIKYACYDSIITYQLFEYFYNRLKEEEVEDNYYNFIIPSVNMIFEVEMIGIKIDMNYLIEYANSLLKRAKEIEDQFYKLNNNTYINLNSNKQVSELLEKNKNFEVLKDDEGNEYRTKSGDLKLDKETLKLYVKSGNEMMSIISEYNHIMKELSSFGFNIKNNNGKLKSEIKVIDIKENKSKEIDFFFKQEKIDEDDEKETKGFLASLYNGRLHGGYKLHGTKTGRMSGSGGLESNSSINWQNIPKTKEFRKIILPTDGYVFFEFDYTGMEVDIFSQISGKGELERLILENKDMHCYTATQVMNILGYNVTYEEVVEKTKIEGKEDEEFLKFRKNSKQTNFLLLYNGTAYGLANQLDIPVEQAELFVKAFEESYPEFKIYVNRNKEFASKYGYVKTLLGRKRRLPKLTYSKLSFYDNCTLSQGAMYTLRKELNNQWNIAVNAPVQGTSGQITLIAMVNAQKKLKEINSKSRILGNVHDSIFGELYIDTLERDSKILEEAMITPYYKNVDNNQVQLKVDCTYGEIWGFGYTKEYWDKNPEEWKKCLNNIKQRNKKLNKEN